MATMSESFILPYEQSTVTSNFGPRFLNPKTGALVPMLATQSELEQAILQDHDGVDARLPEGAEVLCPADGVVSLVTDNEEESGFSISIQHGTGAVMSVFGHLQERPPFEKGDKVKQGDVIGLVGNTGNSTAPHLHYSVLVRGVAYNPETVASKWDYYRTVAW